MSDPAAVTAVASCGEDAIHIAAQLGRLDFASALLASVAILLVIAAFPSYLIIKNKAEKIAKDAANTIRAEAVSTAEKVALEKLEQDLPSLVEDYMGIVKNAVNDELAAEIAQAQEDGGNA